MLKPNFCNMVHVSQSRSHYLMRLALIRNLRYSLGPVHFGCELWVSCPDPVSKAPTRRVVLRIMQHPLTVGRILPEDLTARLATVCPESYRLGQWFGLNACRF